jgi:hypothetical protein
VKFCENYEDTGERRERLFDVDFMSSKMLTSFRKFYLEKFLYFFCSQAGLGLTALASASQVL